MQGLSLWKDERGEDLGAGRSITTGPCVFGSAGCQDGDGGGEPFPGYSMSPDKQGKSFDGAAGMLMCH